MEYVIFLLIALVALFVISYRNSSGEKVYKYISTNAENIYEKYSPYSYKEVRKKVKELGQDYTKKQYLTQIAVFAAGAAVVTYLYFYSLIVSIIGLVQVNKSGEEGKGLSIAGIIISAIFILLLIIVALFFVISPAILIAAFEEYQPNEFYYY